MIGFSWQSSPVGTELEMITMDWLAQLCGLPQKFLFSRAVSGGAGSGNGGDAGASRGMQGATADAHAAATGAGGGVIQGSSSEAVLVAMLAAKARAMRGRPAADGLKLVAYGSDQTHSCFKKATMILGLDQVRVLPTSGDSDWTLRPEALEAAIQEDLANGLIPFFVGATIGTTSSCAVDPIPALGGVATRHGLWLHVDAAYAGCAGVCPELRGIFDGLEDVDSYQFNPHKWLATSFDCCAMWVADSAALKEALSLTPVYLRTRANGLDYKDWQVPLGRRFRALKLWMVLRMYGGEGLRGLIRHHCAIAAWLVDQVRSDPRFELAAPPRLGLVCFRLKGAENATNVKLLEAVNSSGQLFMVGSELSGRFMLRLAVGSPQVQLRHVAAAWEVLQREATALLQQQPEALSAAAAGAPGKQ